MAEIGMVTEKKFKSILKAVHLTKYTIEKSKVVIATDETGRAERAITLKNLATVIPGAVYKADKSAGWIAAEIDGKKYKIFLKPHKVANAILLKPQFFSGITDIDIKFRDYYKRIKESIESHDKLDQQQKTYLIDLLNYHNGFKASDLVTWKESFKSTADSISVNTLNNDFGEILGPLAVVHKKLLPIPAPTATVFLPHRGNEPLLDYKMYSGKKVYKISAKSGDTTNTLKPGDVKGLIDAEKKLFNKYKNTIQYKIIEILVAGSTKQGPIDALYYLKSRRFKEAQWLKDKIYSEEIRQSAENSLVSISKTQIDFTEMYQDSTRAKVFYVKFKLGTDGTPQWNILKDAKNRQEATKRTVLTIPKRS
jgi:hypothetical protein